MLIFEKGGILYSFQKNIGGFLFSPFSPFLTYINVITALVLRLDAVMYRCWLVVFTLVSFVCSVLLECDFAYPTNVTLKKTI